MSSSQGDKRSSDIEMGEATSQAPVPVSSGEAPACVAGFLSFQEKLARRKAEKEPVPQDAGTQVETSVPCVPDASAQPTGSSTTPILVEDREKAAESIPPPPVRKEIVLALRAPSAAPLPSSSALVVAPTHGFEVQVPQDAETQVETSVPCVPDASAQPTGSSTTSILVEDKEKAAESMSPPPARKEIVLELCAPSAALVVQPKGRKRWCTTGNDGESSQQGGLNLVPGLRGMFVSLIDGMISE
ncbi:hypothetical protein F2Q70_00029854 [Brassica cretica]|uniref:Uncharacterized protein n=1 Tax=Brassica cretica TaxID=69181 RepID=A0A8S9FFD3_BRACR|nr:hypothetical protein F2Q70_00029854 [Brassica cretica]